MPKRIALVGHCGPDASYLRMAVAGVFAGAQIVAADEEAALDRLIEEGVDLVLVNRQLDWGFDSDEGVETIRHLRQTHPTVRMMLISNYPEAQQAAVAAGALPGFGKREIGTKRVTELLREAVP